MSGRLGTRRRPVYGSFSCAVLAWTFGLVPEIVTSGGLGDILEGRFDGTKKP